MAAPIYAKTTAVLLPGFWGISQCVAVLLLGECNHEKGPLLCGHVATDELHGLIIKWKKDQVASCTTLSICEVNICRSNARWLQPGRGDSWLASHPTWGHFLFGLTSLVQGSCWYNAKCSDKCWIRSGHKAWRTQRSIIVSPWEGDY